MRELRELRQRPAMAAWRSVRACVSIVTTPEEYAELRRRAEELDDDAALVFWREARDRYEARRREQRANAAAARVVHPRGPMLAPTEQRRAA